MNKLMLLNLMFCLFLFGCEKEEEAPFFIEKFEPLTAAPGSSVIIYGGKMYNKGIKVYFGENKAEIKDASSNNIFEVIVPKGLDGEQVKIKLVSNDYQVESTDYFIVPALPKITTIEPLELSVRDTVIVVKGMNFNYFENFLQLSFIDSQGNIKSTSRDVLEKSDTEMKFSLRGGNAGNFKLSLTGSPTYTIDSPTEFYTHTSYDFTPKVTSAGKEITITFYKNFAGEQNSVKIGDQELQFLWSFPAGDGKFEVGYKLPEDMVPGEYDLSITDPNGKRVIYEKDIKLLIE